MKQIRFEHESFEKKTTANHFYRGKYVRVKRDGDKKGVYLDSTVEANNWRSIGLQEIRFSSGAHCK